MRAKTLRLLLGLWLAASACAPAAPVTTAPTAQPRASASPPPVGSPGPSAAAAPPGVPATAKSTPPAAFNQKRAAYLTDTARLLAGMPVSAQSPLRGLQEQLPSRDHPLEQDWARFSTEQLPKLRAWSRSELSSVIAQRAVFYPFGGPDFLYVHALFPEAERYILVGLEPVMAIPDLTAEPPLRVAARIKATDQSMRSVLTKSFFDWPEMKVQLSRQGVLPILFIQLARMGCTILQIRFVELHQDGSVDPAPPSGRSKPNGVQIAFLPEGGRAPKILLYLAVDISNQGLRDKPGLGQLVEGLTEPVTYIKAASYRMHFGTFSAVRDLILAQSSVILQDDTGIPFRSFDTARWQLRLYGRYAHPVPRYTQFYQADLQQAFASSAGVEPLDLSIGYRPRLGAHLILALAAKSRPHANRQLP